MICRSCGAEIADKALICYRCGTATTEAKYKPAAVRGKSKRGPMLIIVAILIAILLGLAYLYLRGTPPQTAAPAPGSAIVWSHGVFVAGFLI
jgi:hypothetical protein